jgi:hypothetical protein
MTHAIPPSVLSCRFLSFWGKARPGEEEGPQYHPVWAHGLDVAAAGEALLQAFPQLIARAAEFLGWSVADFGATWSTFWHCTTSASSHRSFRTKFAHAGMNRPSPAPTSSSSSVPRTRGDEPVGKDDLFCA